MWLSKELFCLYIAAEYWITGMTNTKVTCRKGVLGLEMEHSIVFWIMSIMEFLPHCKLAMFRGLSGIRKEKSLHELAMSLEIDVPT